MESSLPTSFRKPVSCVLVRKLYDEARATVRRQNHDPAAIQGYLRRVSIRFQAKLKAAGIEVEGA
jgi:hypothetical protein